MPLMHKHVAILVVSICCALITSTLVTAVEDEDKHAAPADDDDDDKLMKMNTTTTICHTGFLIDMACWDMPGHIAIDGAPLETEPEKHTVHCMRDIPVCRQNGFAVLKPSTTNSTYEIAYSFDSAGNERSLELVDTSKKVDNYTVTVCGTAFDMGSAVFFDDAPILNITNMTEVS